MCFHFTRNRIVPVRHPRGHCLKRHARHRKLTQMLCDDQRARDDLPFERCPSGLSGEGGFAGLKLDCLSTCNLLDLSGGGCASLRSGAVDLQ